MLRNNKAFLKLNPFSTHEYSLFASKKKLEKLIIPLLVKLAKSPEAYIHWPNRAEVIEAQLKKIVAITRG